MPFTPIRPVIDYTKSFRKVAPDGQVRGNLSVSDAEIRFGRPITRFETLEYV